jgi:hypothetical protein
MLYSALQVHSITEPLTIQDLELPLRDHIFRFFFHLEGTALDIEAANLGHRRCHLKIRVPIINLTTGNNVQTYYCSMTSTPYIRLREGNETFWEALQWLLLFI